MVVVAACCSGRCPVASGSDSDTSERHHSYGTERVRVKVQVVRVRELVDGELVIREGQGVKLNKAKIYVRVVTITITKTYPKRNPKGECTARLPYS